MRPEGGGRADIKGSGLGGLKHELSNCSFPGPSSTTILNFESPLWITYMISQGRLIEPKNSPQKLLRNHPCNQARHDHDVCASRNMFEYEWSVMLATSSWRTRHGGKFVLLHRSTADCLTASSCHGAHLRPWLPIVLMLLMSVMHGA